MIFLRTAAGTHLVVDRAVGIGQGDETYITGTDLTVAE